MTQERLEDMALNVTAVALASVLWVTGALLLLVEGTSRRLTPVDDAP